MENFFKNLDLAAAKGRRIYGKVVALAGFFMAFEGDEKERDGRRGDSGNS